MSGILSVGGAGAVGVSGFYPVQINDSLRFNDDDSAYLNRTPSSASNRKTWTFSAWIKLSSFTQGERGIIFQSNYGGPTIYQDSGLRFAHAWDPAGTDYIRETVAVFRDPSAWYHVVWWCDTTQAGTRWKIYVNGVEQSLQTPSGNNGEPAQNTDLNINSANSHTIGNFIGNYFDGYMAEVNFIDGTALDATSFGEAKDGTWIPKSYSGSYGTNGFHLEFNGNTNDTSGNSNNWTANNISAHDYVPDSPTNNFGTFNPLMYRWASNTTTLSEGNLKSTGSSGYAFGTINIPTSGKWYFETYTVAGTSVGTVGVGDGNLLQNSSVSDVVYYFSNGNKSVNGTVTAYGATWTTGDVIGVACDADSNTVTFYKNGSSQGSISYDPSGTTVFFGNWGTTGYFVLNHGQDSTFAGNTTAGGNTDGNGIGDFKYAPPSGFLALCTANLPEPTIISGAEYFNTVLYTGNASTQSITGVGFQPDLVWLKQRSSPTRSHRLNDSVRGANKQLYPDLINAEGTATNELTSFDSDGFSLGSANGVNGIDTYVGWNWKAGTAFSNSAGSNGATIASSGSVNTDAGFSIVSYVGTGSAGTVYHGLSSTPEFITIKDRDYATGRPWGSYHFKLNNGVNPEDERIQLNEVTSETNDTFIFNSTAPTSNVFSVALSSWNNTSNNDIIAYCFHSVDGYSKVGSYTGNGLADGPFVFTGFRPAWVLIKSRTAGYDWVLDDAVRSPYNEGNATLYPNDSYVEYTGGLYGIDFLSNGFKPRTSYGQYNQSGGGYIYLAFAESPQKYSNAR